MNHNTWIMTIVFQRASFCEMTQWSIEVNGKNLGRFYMLQLNPLNTIWKRVRETWLHRNEDELGHIHFRAVRFSYSHTSVVFNLAQLNVNLCSRIKICTDFTSVSLHIVTVSTDDHSLVNHLVWLLTRTFLPECFMQISLTRTSLPSLKICYRLHRCFLYLRSLNFSTVLTKISFLASTYFLCKLY